MMVRDSFDEVCTSNPQWKEQEELWGWVREVGDKEVQLPVLLFVSQLVAQPDLLSVFSLVLGFVVVGLERRPDACVLGAHPPVYLFSLQKAQGAVVCFRGFSWSSVFKKTSRNTYSQKSVTIQPRMNPLKFGKHLQIQC